MKIKTSESIVSFFSKTLEFTYLSGDWQRPLHKFLLSAAVGYDSFFPGCISSLCKKYLHFAYNVL